MLTRSKTDSKTNDMEVQTKVNVRRKESNYTKEEDKFLCRAWKTTPMDQEEETDQFSGTFWGRIKEKYTILIGSSYVSRTGRSLLNRWSRIRNSVSNFCAVYKSTREQNPNSSEQEMIKLALLAYKKEKKENFSFLHCWAELRNSPKWKDEGVSKYGLRRKGKLDEQFNIDGENNCPMLTDMPLERSKRQKLAKQVPNEGTDANVFSPEILPPSTVSALNCSSGVINFDPNNHTATNVRQEASELVTAKNKESNYSQEEDLFLCMAWMATSWRSTKDPDQILVTDWQRVEEEYGKLISNDYALRLPKSLLSRWHKIKSDVLKFCYMYENIIDQNSSCYTEKDKINTGRLTFKKKLKRKFRFYHCWTVLRDSPKWNEMLADYRPRMVAMYSQEPITIQNYSLDDRYDSPVAMETSLEQAEGEGLEDYEVASVEEEEKEKEAGLHSPPAASSPLSAMSTPVLISREMGINTQNHVGDDVQIEASKKVSTRKKESNYSPEEDLFLCRAWITTKDLGRKHSSTTLWGKIGEVYASFIGDEYAPRVGKSLLNRWSRIRVAVESFCTIYKKINDQNPSSCTDADKINMAMLAYQKERKEKFRFLHCWTVLRHSSKWKSEYVNGVRCSRGRHFAAQQSSSSDHFNNNDDENDESPVPIPTPLDEPKEQELGVGKRKGQDVGTSSSDVEELLPQKRDRVREIIMNQSQMNKVVTHKRKEQGGDAGSSEVEKPVSMKNDIAREMLEIEREKRETKIMLIDPTTLPDGRRQYFEKLQQKILERVCGTPSPRN